MIAAMFVVCVEQPSEVHCADNCCLVNFEDEAPRLCYSILVMMRDISSASRACGGTLAQKKSACSAELVPELASVECS